MENQQESCDGYSDPSRDNPEHLDENGIPLKSPPHFLFNSKSCWKNDDNDRIFYKYTSLSLFPFGMILAVMIFNLYLYIKFFIPLIPEKWHFTLYTQAFFCLYSIFNMEIARWKNPGYLPWNWSLSKKKKYTFMELVEGHATNKEQIHFARSRELPKRGWFSGQYGFMVLRADHACYWLDHWIGLYNHKWFVLSLINGSIFMICGWLMAIYIILFIGFPYKWYIVVAAIGIEGFFTTVGCGQTIVQLLNLTTNTTTIERLNKWTKKYYHGPCSGWTEVCGPLKFLPTWCLPCRFGEIHDGFDFYEREKWTPMGLVFNSDEDEIKPFL